MFVKKVLVPYPPHKQQGDDHHGEHVQDYKLPSRLHLSIEILMITLIFLTRTSLEVGVGLSFQLSWGLFD